MYNYKINSQQSLICVFCCNSNNSSIKYMYIFCFSYIYDDISILLDIHCGFKRL